MQCLLLLCLPGQITAPKDFLDSATKLNPELMGVGDIQAEPADATNPLILSQGDKATATSKFRTLKRLYYYLEYFYYF